MRVTQNMNIFLSILFFIVNVVWHFEDLLGKCPLPGLNFSSTQPCVQAGLSRDRLQMTQAHVGSCVETAKIRLFVAACLVCL